jgi:hypothetical protein
MAPLHPAKIALAARNGIARVQHEVTTELFCVFLPIFASS